MGLFCCAASSRAIIASICVGNSGERKAKFSIVDSARRIAVANSIATASDTAAAPNLSMRVASVAEGGTTTVRRSRRSSEAATGSV